MAPGMAGCGEKGIRLTSSQCPARQSPCLETGPGQPGNVRAHSLAEAPAAAPPPDAKPSNPPWVGAQVSVSMSHLEHQVCRAWQQVGGGRVTSGGPDADEAQPVMGHVLSERRSP